MKKSRAKELIEDFLYLAKRIIRPRNISKVLIDKISDDIALNRSLFNDGQSFVVNDIRISENDHMRVYPCASSNFIKHNTIQSAMYVNVQWISCFVCLEVAEKQAWLKVSAHLARILNFHLFRQMNGIKNSFLTNFIQKK